MPRLGIVAVAALLWGLGDQGVAAQGPYQREVLAGFSNLGFQQRAKPDLVDLDDDGDLDAVVGDASGGLRYYENTGSSSAPVFVGRTGGASPFDGLDVGTSSAPDLVDLDGDGDFDLVIGREDGQAVYFENTGSPGVPAFVQRIGSDSPFVMVDVGFRATPSVVDLDGDGDFDAPFGAHNVMPQYFENTGSSSVPVFVQRTGGANPLPPVGGDRSTTPDLVDLDGDGDLDMVAGERYGQIRYFENTGSSNAATFLGRTGGVNPFAAIDLDFDSSPALADLDGDDDLDAVVGDEHGYLHYFVNTGSSNVPAFVAPTGSADPLTGIDLGRSSTPALADLDGDGDFDLAFGVEAGVLRYFVNTGGPAVPSFAEQSASANPFDGFGVGASSSPTFVDFDGDLDLDVVVGEFDGNLGYFENTGTSTSPAFAERTGAANPFDGVSVIQRSKPSLADLDGDGDLDLLSGESVGTLHYFLNTGGSGAPAFVEQTGSANPFDGVDLGNVSHPSLLDFDGDGDFDAVIGSGFGQLSLFENVGTPLAAVFVQRTGNANPFGEQNFSNDAAPALADLDGDGDLDVLVGTTGGRVLFLRSLHALLTDGFESGDTTAWSVTFEGP